MPSTELKDNSLLISTNYRRFDYVNLVYIDDNCLGIRLVVRTIYGSSWQWVIVRF
jgi:hypothetical protein